MRRRRYRIIERTNSADAGLGFVRKKVGAMSRFRTSNVLTRSLYSFAADTAAATGFAIYVAHLSRSVAPVR